MPCATSRLTELSSASRMRALRSANRFSRSRATGGSALTCCVEFRVGGTASACAPSARRPNRAVNQTSEPCPAVLLTPIAPPISSASCFEMASPRPVPPCNRVVEVSTWLNFSKSRPILLAGMPMPVSRTVKRRRTEGERSLAATSTCTATSPAEVNLMALLTRLVRIWRRRPGSPRSSAGTAGSTVQRSSRPLLCADAARTAERSSIRPVRSKSRVSRSSFLASIFEKSRISLSNPSRPSPLTRTMLA